MVSAGIGPSVGTLANPGLAQLISSNRETLASSQLRCVYPGRGPPPLTTRADYRYNGQNLQFVADP